MKKKHCNRCGKNKPITEFNRRKNHNTTGTIYYLSNCRGCMVERMLEWKKRNRERYLKYQTDYHRKSKQNA